MKAPITLDDKTHSNFQIEMHFGSPRDIEWAVNDDEIYLLQVRRFLCTNCCYCQAMLHTNTLYQVFGSHEEPPTLV